MSQEAQMRMSSRVSTGVTGLDELLEGGIPRGGTYLITGSTGTGKSIFAMQFIYKGIVDQGEPGVFIAMDETPSKLKRHFSAFGWDLDKLEDEGKLAMVDAISTRISAPSAEKYILRRNEIDALLYKASTVIGEIGAKRFVLDSIVPVAYQYDNLFELRRDVQRFFFGVAQLDCTSFVVTEIPGGSERLSRFDVEQFVADGIIVLGLEKRQHTFVRTLMVRKMRGTSHSMEIHEFTVGKDGIAVVQGRGRSGF
ncbi:MAG: ATPase domain-containing protein [Promethearchaeota archaeon]